MMADQGLTTASRMPVWLATGASLIWLLFLGWLVQQGEGWPADNAGLAELVNGWAAPALAPVAAMFAVAAALMATSRPAGAWPPVPAEDPLDGAEADLAGTIARVTTVREMLAQDVALLGDAASGFQARAKEIAEQAATISAHTSAAQAAGAALAEQLPQMAAQASQMVDAATESGETLRTRAEGLNAMAAALGEAFARAGERGASATSAIEGALDGLQDRINDARAAAAALVADLQNHAARSFESNAQAMAGIDKAVTGQAAAIAASLQEARTLLEAIGGETQQRLAAQIAGLTSDAEALDQRLQAQIGACAQLGQTAERSFQLLDSRLELSMKASADALERLQEKIAAVNAQTDQVAQPLRDGKAAAVELQSAVAALRETVLQTIDVMGKTLPEHTVEASRSAETLSSELMKLVSAIETAHGRANALAEPIAESRAVVDAATTAFGEQRAAMETAGQALVVELEQARQLIAEVEEQTRDSSLAAATRLVDAMGRVREVANQAAGTMRETLDGVIAEARQSLAAAADQAMQQSFVGPIGAQAEQAAAAAQAASETTRLVSERAAASLLALATTMKQVEERAGRSQESLEALIARDLAASTQLLTDRMAASAISLAGAMGKPMTDAELLAWRRGERSMFGRRLVAMLEKDEKKALAAKLQAEPDLADAARRHIAEFEALLARVGGDGPLARALSQSDSGRISMILSEALED